MPVTIRHVEPDDYEAFAKIFGGSRAVWWTSTLPYPSAEMWRQQLVEQPEDLCRLVACVDGEVVGQLGLYTSPNQPRCHHVGQIGIVVRDDWQGKGVGTALMQAAIDLADKWVNLSRLELEVYTDNEPAIKLYQKFGFVIKGTGANYGLRDGEFVDVYFMARLRPSD